MFPWDHNYGFPIQTIFHQDRIFRHYDFPIVDAFSVCGAMPFWVSRFPALNFDLRQLYGLSSVGPVLLNRSPAL